MDVLAVIPVTDVDVAGRRLAGRPLLAHAIGQAMSARGVGQLTVVVPEGPLAQMARELGATTVAPAPHGTAAAAALAQALAALDRSGGFLPQWACVLDCVSPLCSAELIDGALDHLIRVGADSLITVHALADPVWLRDDGGRAEPADPRPTRQRFVQSGALLAVRVSAFEREAAVPAGRIVLFEIPWITTLRLRTPEDWRTAEALLAARRTARLAGRLAGRLQHIRLLALDFDGVMTDNRVLVLEDGREAVLCNRGDGMGLELLRGAGFPVVVISKEGNPVVSARCRKLKLPCEQGVEDKLSVLRRIAAERGLELAEVAFFGNDVNDLECLRAAGLSFAPADAHPSVLREVDHVTAALGGFGAVREVCDLLVSAIAAAEPREAPPALT